jgi:hypothetical protein
MINGHPSHLQQASLLGGFSFAPPNASRDIESTMPLTADLPDFRSAGDTEYEGGTSMHGFDVKKFLGLRKVSIFGTCDVQLRIHTSATQSWAPP